MAVLLENPMSRTLLAVLIAAGGCATETVRWGEETVVDTPAGAAATAEETEKKEPMTAAAYAAKFPTDGACETEARRIDTKKRDLALKLLGTCIDRGDFKRLTALTEGPWTPALKKEPEAARWCARIVAARAGDVDADVKACARVGLSVKTLEQIYGETAKVKGAMAIFRARPDPEFPRNDSRLVETALEDGEVDPGTTGRRVIASFMGKRGLKGDSVVLARVLRVEEDAATEEGELVAVVEVIAAYPSAQIPTF